MHALNINEDNHSAQLKLAVQHLESCDARFSDLFRTHGLPKITVSRNLFLNLIKSIIFQQLAGSAAQKIFSRFLKVFYPNVNVDENLKGSAAFAVFFNSENLVLTPSAVVDIDPQVLKDVGLSGRKVEYVQGLAKSIISGELDLENIRAFSDETVTRQITSIRGLGPWTADMFKMVDCLFDDMKS